MSSTIIGDMEVRLRADIARLQRDMEDARRIAGNAMDRIGRAANAAKSAIGAIAGALSVAAFGAWIKAAIDTADAAGEVAAKTGVAIKHVAGLQLNFQLGGLSAEAMTSSMAKLSKGIVDGDKTLAALGIRTKNTDGSFRDSRDVLYSVADQFAELDDGARKTALAIDLFGKAGADMIPLLNGGSKAMKEMDDMAVKLGLSISQEAAEQAGQFNDTLDLLGKGSQGVAQGLAAELLPALSSLAGAFLTTMTEGDKVKKTADFIGTGFKMLYSVGVGVVEVFSTVGKVIGGTVAGITSILGGYADVVVKIIAGDWKGAAASVVATFDRASSIAVGMGEEIGAGWRDSAKSISDAWSGAGSDMVDQMAKIRKGSAVLGKDAADQAKEEAKRKKEAEEAEKALAKGREDSFKLQKSYLDTLAAVDKMKYADVDQEIANATKEAEANEKLIDTFGKTRLAIEQASLARIQDQLAQSDSIALTERDIEKLQALAAAKQRNISALGKAETLDQGTDVAKAKELLEIMGQIDEVTKSAAAGMAESFGRVGSAIGSLTTALSGYGRAQAAIAAQLAVSVKDANGDSGKIAKANSAAAQQSAQAQVRSYADMSKAAKGFFKENSTGYKMMEGAEKAFRAYEMAMAVQNMVAKSGILTAFTGLFVTSKATQTAAESAAVGPSIVAANAQSSAWGVTAVVKAIASMPFPANLAAGAATLAAVVAIGAKMMGGVSGGSVSVSEQRQKTQGTGSVLGDSGAKSESISRSIELAATNSSIELNYTAGMLRALLSIESAMTGLGGILAQGGVNGDSPATSFGSVQQSFQTGAGSKLLGLLDPILAGVTGKLLGSVANSLFGGKVTTLDAGVTASKTSLGSVMSGGINASQYVDSKKDGGWFKSDKYSTSMQGLGTEANAQFAKVITNMAQAVREAGGLLGQGGDAFNAHLQRFVVDIGKISMKGLSSEEIQKQLEAVFSKVGDDMARFAVSGLAPFQQVGEGYLETLVRISTNYANLDATLQSIGMTFGATGMASVGARERLIDLMGGIDELASSASSFAENYLSSAERLAPVQKYVSDQLAAMGLSSLNTRDKFKDYVLGLDLTKEAQQKQYAALMQLESAFAKTHAATKDLTKSEQEIADERASLQERLDQLTMSSAQLRARERATLAESNRGLFDQINAREDLAEAYDRESSAIKSLVDGMKSAQSSTLAYKDSLSLGSQSMLTPLQKAAEAQRQYEASVAKAMANPTDASAYGASQAAATAFLSASQIVNASSDAQVAAVAKVQKDMEMLAALAGSQVTDAQQQLSLMDKQYGQLVTLNQTAIGFKDALNQMHLVLASSAASSQLPQINFAEIGTSNMAPLVAEIKALRASNEQLTAEVAASRQDAFKHTAALIASGAQVAQQGSQAVVDGYRGAHNDALWSTRTTEILE